jgi:hypothetical protein
VGQGWVQWVIWDPREEGCCTLSLRRSVYRELCLQVRYVKGSPLSGLDLSRARDSSADAVFVLSSDMGHPALSEGFDMEAALACRSAKMSSPWTPVYCQVSAP